MCVSFAFYATFKFSSSLIEPSRIACRGGLKIERLEIYTILRSNKKFVKLYFGLTDICHILLGWMRCDCVA